MIVKESGSNIEPIPSGIHSAVCYSIVDIGSIMNKKFGNMQRKLIITWEIPLLRIKIEKDGKIQDLPRVISKTYTMSISEKSYLRRDLESWRGKAFTPEELGGFDIFKVLRANCQLNIIHETVGTNIYSNISAIVPATVKNAPENPVLTYSIDDDRDEIPSHCPEWLVKKIKESPEYQGLFVQNNAPDFDDGHLPIDTDDIPF